MDSKLVVSNITFLSFLLAILNIIDLWFLSLNVIGLNVNIFQILLIGILSIPFYIYSKKLNLLQIKLFLFFVIYLIFQFLNSLFSNADLLSSLSVFIMLFFIAYVVLSLRNYENDKLYKILFLVVKYTIFLIILFDLLNHLVGGNSLFIIFQNNAPIILMSLVILSNYANNSKQKKVLISLFIIYVVWTIISYNLGNSYLRIQYKSVILLGLILITLFFIIKFRVLVPLFNNRLFLRYLSPFLFLFIIVALFSIASYVYEIIIELIPRRGSGEIRIAVAEVMFTETTQNIFNIIFGQGLGSSGHTFLLSDNKLVKSHSGLMVLFYEQGIAGLVLLIIFGLSFFIRKKIYILYFKYKRGQALFFLLLLTLLWIVQNIIYIIGFPAPEVFHQSQIISYILLATFLSNKLFIPKEKF